MGKPLLFDLVNAAYNGASNALPDFLRDRPMFSAFSMASLSTYGLAKLAQYVSKNHVSKVIPDFDKKYLPKIEKACQYGIPALALMYSAIDPEGAKAILMQHPVYTAGMAGAFAGGFVAAQHDLDQKRTIEDKLV